MTSNTKIYRGVRRLLSYTFMAVLMGFVFMSCNNSHDRSLAYHIDDLVELNPHKGILFIDSIKKTNRYTNISCELLYLLKYKALDKAHLDISGNDSIIKILPEIQKEGDKFFISENLYYIGRYYYARNDAPQAVKYFKLAEQSTKDLEGLNVSRLNSVISSQLGYLFYFQDLDKRALYEFRKSYKYAYAIKDTTKIIFCLKDIASVYSKYGKRQNALKICQQAYALSIKQKNVTMQAIMALQIARHYHFLRNSVSAYPYLKMALHANLPEDRMALYSIAESVYAGLGKSDSMLVYLNKLFKLNNPYAKQEASKELCLYYSKMNDIKYTRFYLQEYVLYSDSVSKAASADAVNKMNSLYDYSLRETKNQELKLQNQRIRFWLSFVIVLIFILSLASVVYIYVGKQRNEKLKYKLLTYKQLVSKNEFLGNRYREKEDVIINIHNSILSKTRIRDNKCLNNDEWDEIYSEFQNHYPSFLSELKRLCKMNENEIHVCFLTKLGFAPKDISALTAHSRSSISLTRKRLYERAFGKNGNPSEWDDIVINL